MKRQRLFKVVTLQCCSAAQAVGDQPTRHEYVIRADSKELAQLHMRDYIQDAHIDDVDYEVEVIHCYEVQFNKMGEGYDGSSLLY